MSNKVIDSTGRWYAPSMLIQEIGGRDFAILNKRATHIALSTAGGEDAFAGFSLIDGMALLTFSSVHKPYVNHIITWNDTLQRGTFAFHKRVVLERWLRGMRLENFLFLILPYEDKFKLNPIRWK